MLCKKCNRCGKIKPLDEFVKDSRKPNGRGSSCTSCRGEYLREWNKLPHAKKAKRRYAIANREKAAAASRKYAKANREKRAESQAKWIQANPEKRRAHIAVGNAVRDGRLVKMPCEICGTTENVDAHHEDYSKPLCVRWFCHVHHFEFAHEYGEALGEMA